MDYAEYQALARTTAIYPNQGQNMLYPVLGIANEVGELITPIKKMVRSSMLTPDNKKAQQIKDEAGDVLWYVSQTCCEADFNLADVVAMAAAEQAKAETLHTAAYAAIHLARFSGRIASEFAFERNSRDFADSLHDLLVCLLTEVIAVIDFANLTLEEVAQANLDKLFARKDAGVIEGDGSLADRLAAKGGLS